MRQQCCSVNFDASKAVPRAKEDITRLPPEQMVDDILAKERRIMEIMET